MKKAILLFGFCFSLIIGGFGQQATDLKQVFLAAESYYLFEEFEEALPLYLRVHRSEPDNYNLYFKIGVCYLNDPYEKDKSIFYLEKASKNINPKYKDSNYKEMGAPLDALFYLGNAYHINNDLIKAREAYKNFQSRMNTEIYNDKLVLEQLSACDAAEKMMKKPVDTDVEILSNQINTRFADINAAVSGDESKMVFISELQFYDAIFYTEKKNGNWTTPRNITPELGVDGDVYPTCLSFDGTLLFIYRNDDFTGNIYTSSLVNDKWTPIVKLNDNINTKYWESHASVTKDGNNLYFTSNRKGGFGGLDIYRSSKQENGDWGPPVNLGASVNSAYNEETPFITENGRRLFFSSYGHFNMGGHDVFMSVMKSDSTWASPVNLGYPVNSTDDEVFFCPVKDGEIAYFSVFSETGYGKHDIYRYKVYTADHPRKYDISGILNYSGESVSGSEVTINLISQNSGDTLTTVHPNDNGKFNFSIPAGKYYMVFDSKKFERLLKSLEVSQNTPHSGMILTEPIKLRLLPVKLSREELDKKLMINDSLILVTNGKPVEIKYEAEKGSTVVITQFLNSELVKVDTVQVDKRKQTYLVTPQPGQNKIEFALTDSDGNQVTKSVTIVYSRDDDTSQTSPQVQQNTGLQQPETALKVGIAEASVIALINEMASRSDGRLKEVLENLDPQKEGITNTGELFTYLYANTETLGYSKEDVDRLTSEMISKKSLAEFLSQLQNASEGNLKTAIFSLDPKTNNIVTANQAVDYLIRNSQKLNYKPEDVVKALAIVGSNGEKDSKVFVNKLIHTTDEGDLKVYLKGLDLSTIGTIPPEDFSIALYHNSIGKSFSEADVLNALTNLAVSREAAGVLEKLILLADEGSLKDFLININLEEEGIYTAGQLIDHLYANADMKGYTSEDVDKLLQKYLYNQVAEIEDLRLKMVALATGNLKDFLEKTDLNEHSFGSREEFIDYLRSQAGNNGYTQEDINNILLKLAYTGDLDDIIKQLILHSDGNLKKTLENLDPQKEGITSFDELIRYLLDNSEQFGYSKEDVYKMLSEYTSATNLAMFMKKLIRLADPETKIFLENINLNENAINDRTDLISFLLKKAAEGSVNQEKMIRLLLQATDTKVEDILPVIQSRSSGELNKLLQSGKLPVKNFSSAADLYDYLLAASEKNKGITASDINQLFSDYLIDNALNQFLGQLIDHSDGKLNEFLRKINLKESGITSVSGLVHYLIANAAQNGYTEDDVFRLIEKILGRERLEDFVANLREFAPAGLARLLDQLDLDKAGINNIEDLMKYLAEHAAEYGYSMEDVWNAILQMVISGDAGDRDKVLSENKQTAHAPLGRGVAYTIGIFCLLGVFIFLLILIKRKQEKKKDQ
jgi:hypothetical protein